MADMNIVAEIKKIPPVTRFLILSSLGVTIPVVLHFVSPYKLVFITAHVIKKWEVSGSTVLLSYSCIAQCFVVLESLHKFVLRK